MPKSSTSRITTTQSDIRRIDLSSPSETAPVVAAAAAARASMTATPAAARRRLRAIGLAPARPDRPASSPKG